jgi:hypothetical protein
MRSMSTSTFLAVPPFWQLTLKNAVGAWACPARRLRTMYHVLHCTTPNDGRGKPTPYCVHRKKMMQAHLLVGDPLVIVNRAYLTIAFQ